MQYELDALDPDDLQDLYRSAIDEFWDESAYEDVLTREAVAQRVQLDELAQQLRDIE